MFGKVRMRILWASTALFVLATGAVPQTQVDAIDTALELCANPPEDTEIARYSLGRAGWKEADDAAFLALYNAVAKFQFNPTDLGFTFRNAEFVAASVLGNSALGRDQIGVHFGEHRLAVLGIPEGTPYCVVSGPLTLLGAVTGADGFSEGSRQTAESIETLTGKIRDHVNVAAAQFDMAAVNASVASSDLPADQVVQIASNLDPVTIHIVPSEETK